MEKEKKITAPDGCEIEKVELVDGVAVVTFKEKERKLPKSWEEFCDMVPIYDGECYIQANSDIEKRDENVSNRWHEGDRNLLPDSATAEAVLALCQLIQLRNAYNGDWVPDWEDENRKYTIDFYEDEIFSGEVSSTPSILAFNSRELRDEFLENFVDLIEKLKPLYGIKEGGEE
ncbi:MAG: hypothetical protein II661_00595 [Bacteroidales bacterium]|nr:hypothetical protein [Bacteroidales bacterium]